LISVKSPSISATKPHLLADEIELYLLFFHSGDHFSKSDLITILTQDATDEESTESSAESNLKYENKIETCFRHFQYRANAFSEFYPFNINSSGNLELLPFTVKSAVYQFLLVASMLSQVGKSDSTLLANKFEQICAKALKLWNNNLQVKIFGAGSNDRNNFFGSGTRDALCKLAEFVSATPHRDEIYKKRIDGSFKISNSGDAGLDIVACQPFNDFAAGCLSIFGQCASKKEHWWHKKHEANPINFQTILSFNNAPLNVVFIPVCFRDSNGEWYEEVAPTGCLLIDRVRICSMLAGGQIDDISLGTFVAA